MKALIIAALFLMASTTFASTDVQRKLLKEIEIFDEVIANGGSNVNKYAVESLDLNKETIDLYVEGVKYGGCIDPTAVTVESKYRERDYLSQSMIKNFSRDLSIILDETDPESGNLKTSVLAKLKELLLSDKTIAVVYSGFNSEGQDGDSSESCMYHTFKIFRIDGLKITLNFSYTD